MSGELLTHGLPTPPAVRSGGGVSANSDGNPDEVDFEETWEEVTRIKAAPESTVPSEAEQTEDSPSSNADQTAVGDSSDDPHALSLFIEQITGITAAVADPSGPDRAVVMDIPAGTLREEFSERRSPQTSDVADVRGVASDPEGDPATATASKAAGQVELAGEAPDFQEPAHEPRATSLIASRPPEEMMRSLPSGEAVRNIGPALQPVAAIKTVLGQIADALVTAADDRIEITLSPEELGRIRLIVSGPDRAPHVSVWVERPEVMDLIRRNTTLLHQHFSAAGFEGAAFDFQDGQQEWHDNPPPARAESVAIAQIAPVISGGSALHPARIDGRLDIRL
ncbi:flagellar hook-length control protein FliK [Paracoccus seriniphilus]|uniref:Hook-length control protein FliK n=1 Tax=Paracoccus seriniphilus TaxID=184748 RepID=A0A239PL17_9RHOB|nr:flagellar hook-length control protein FliK [Paracoccus seriniphilus]WCR13885.1 flagellar hook-length control protein FliK [Paracoccus seriniphilus]SNT68492.1 hook-length control protein FliK [Paracoccus seriniphilus]